MPLDREVQDKYTLIVQAYDNYHFGFTTGESRNSFAQVIVSITDVNDQIPVFEEDYVDKPENQHNCAIINEFHDTNEAILTARAKGQLISEYLFDVLNFQKKQKRKFDKFLPKNLRRCQINKIKALSSNIIGYIFIRWTVFLRKFLYFVDLIPF